MDGKWFKVVLSLNPLHLQAPTELGDAKALPRTPLSFHLFMAF